MTEETLILRSMGRDAPPDAENARMAKLLGIDFEYLPPEDEAIEMIGESGWLCAMNCATSDLIKAEIEGHEFRISYWKTVVSRLVAEYENDTGEMDVPDTLGSSCQRHLF